MITVCTSNCLPSLPLPLNSTEKRIQGEVRIQHKRTFQNRCIIQTSQSCSLRGLVILDPHMYCLISIVIITTFPTPFLYIKVLRQVNYTMELHNFHVILSLYQWTESKPTTLSITFNVIVLKIDVPCNMSSAVHVCFLRCQIMSSNLEN